jgi:hypothetical protein
LQPAVALPNRQPAKTREISGDAEKLAKIGNIENLLHVTVNPSEDDLFLGATHFVAQHQEHAER